MSSLLPQFDGNTIMQTMVCLTFSEYWMLIPGSIFISPLYKRTYQYRLRVVVCLATPWGHSYANTIFVC